MNELYPAESNQPTILRFAPLQNIPKEQRACGTPRRELLRAYAEMQRVLLARNRKIACC
jgi:hypothetical protein